MIPNFKKVSKVMNWPTGVSTIVSDMKVEECIDVLLSAKDMYCDSSRQDETEEDQEQSSNNDVTLVSQIVSVPPVAFVDEWDEDNVQDVENVVENIEPVVADNILTKRRKCRQL